MPIIDLQIILILIVNASLNTNYDHVLYGAELVTLLVCNQWIVLARSNRQEFFLHKICFGRMMTHKVPNTLDS